jgi:hypothetical protein
VQEGFTTVEEVLAKIPEQYIEKMERSNPPPEEEPQEVPSEQSPPRWQ